MKFNKVLYLTFLLVFSLSISKAQVTTSAISGVVKTDKNVGLEEATIKVTHEPTGTVKFTKSRKDGRYDITNLDPGGPYTVEVTYVGQKIPAKKDIYLQLGNVEIIDFVAEGSATELGTVIVSAVKGSRTIKNGTSTNFNQRVITSVPNITRSLTNITTLTPQAGGNNSFGGRDGRYNNVQIDGANLNNNFGLSSSLLPGGAVQPISLDAIDEISVNVSPFDVRQGNFTGAGISATTKRGTNKYTGSVYGFYRDEGFLGRKANGQKVPTVTKSSSTIMGARVGGPIIKNKLFFFISAEKEDRDAPGINWKADRGGVPDANTSRTLATDLDAVSNYLKTNFGYETGPYENLGNFITANKKILGRLDWNISDKHSASFKYNYSRTDDDQLLNGNSAPNPRSASNRWSANSMSYENSNYANTNILSTYAFELKSNFNSKLSNQLIATYTRANDPKRSSKSSVFPFIDILKNGDAYISAGYELFSYNNNVQNNTLTINENVTYTTGKHSFTGGISYDKIYVKNQFMRYGTSYYRFASVEDFLTNQTPIAFALTYPYAGQKPYVELDFAQASIYAQDEIKFNDRFKLTLGLRVDRPLFRNELTGNPAISALSFADLNGNTINLDVSQWPKERNYYSPRVGFNWDIEGNKKMIIRGGVGVFTGRFPFVWFTNQPSNSGVIQNTVEVTSNLGGYLFDPDPYKHIANFPSEPGVKSPGSIAVVDRNFKMPQVLRVSAAVDKSLGSDWTLTLEGIYNKDINALLQYNANQKAPIGVTAGPGSRPLFGNTSALRRYNTAISEAMVLTNTNKGGAGIFTAQLSKRFSKNWDASVSYTHTESFDLSGNPGSQASSAWSNIQSVNGNNNLNLAYSDFGTPNRVVAYVSYKKNWNKFLTTTVSLVYTGYEQGRFSYRYSNDYNQDGISSDLIYIPKDPSEITFVNYANNGPTAAEQSAAFFAYIEQDKYLSKRKGQMAERNGAKFPWFSNLDLRVLQDILPISKHRNYGLQLSMDIENFTNLINSSWGVTARTNYNNGAILSVASAPTANAPATYRMNLVSGALPTRTFTGNITVANTWRMNLGVRLNF